MKKTIKIFFINLAVFMVVWTAVELVLQLLGVDTLHEADKKSMDPRFQAICQRALKENPVFYDAFYTDSEGIFKANPAFDFKILFKGNGDYRINSEGFRGNDFKPGAADGITVLLVGDSFVWGYTASPIANCFADLVQTAGYHVYNGGIPGIDPLQYLKVVKKYTPLLKPTVVAVCLFMGNDFNAVPHPTQPYKNLHYVSDFGYFLGYDNRDGHYFNSAEESYAVLKKRYCGCMDNIWDYFLYKTVLGKLVYYGILNKTKSGKTDLSRKWLKDALAEMQQVCRQNNSEFMIFVIPTAQQSGQTTGLLEKNRRLFNDTQYFCPGNLNQSDYQTPPDNHFNNRGHRKFAEFITRVLKEKIHAER